MSKLPDALGLSVSASFYKLDRPLLNQLSNAVRIAQWQYCQPIDEALCLETAIATLHTYMDAFAEPIHLIGHSTAGLLGLLYARRYPERVKSLTLLSVGAYPAVDWHAIYYANLQTLPCCRKTILTQMVHALFGYQAKPIAQMLLRILEQDLESSLSPHSLFKRIYISPESVPVPLLLCRGQDDSVVDPNAFVQWVPCLAGSHHPLEEEANALNTLPYHRWECPNGRYFFHYDQPHPVSRQILKFWNRLGSMRSPQRERQTQSASCNSTPTPL
jgi:pimeloyl-ACP methyl ester carboxylesterase